MAGHNDWLTREAEGPCPRFDDPRDCFLRGVHVLTVKAGETTNGMSVASVTQASHDPPLISVAVALQQTTHELLYRAMHFAICSLRIDQLDLASHFGEAHGRDVDKLSTVPHHPGQSGVPILDDCLVFYECKKYATLPAGDHTIFLGEIISKGIVSPGKQLPYSRFDYESQSVIKYVERGGEQA